MKKEAARLLLVDDQATNLHVLAAMLQSEYMLRFATNGKNALELANASPPPDLILLDVVMPGMSGIEVLRSLRSDSHTAAIPVILVSGDSSEENELHGLDLGADDYMTKPVQANLLQARVRNILLRQRALAQLRLASHVFEHSGEAMMISDSQHKLLHINPAFTLLTGYTQNEVMGQDASLLALDHEQQQVYGRIWQALAQCPLWRGEIWNRRKNGSPFPALLSVSALQNTRAQAEFHFISMVDISEQKASEEEIRHLAYHDALTGLPNRLHLKVHLDTALALARRNSGGLALMFLDLDRFKHINDSLGHDVGDDLLVEVAQRLRQCVRASDLVARLGGDEFVLVLNGNNNRAMVQPVVDKILTSLGRDYQIGTHQITSSPSIGISLFPQDATDADGLMKTADAAMYHAKAMGRNHASYFDRGELDQGSLEKP